MELNENTFKSLGIQVREKASYIRIHELHGLAKKDAGSYSWMTKFDTWQEYHTIRTIGELDLAFKAHLGVSLMNFNLGKS